MSPLPQNVDENMHLMQQYQRQITSLQEHIYSCFSRNTYHASGIKMDEAELSGGLKASRELTEYFRENLSSIK